MISSANRSQARAFYLKELHTAAEELYAQKTKSDPRKPFPLPIDPQGRVIIEVTLNDDAWKRIYKAVYPEQPKEVGVAEEQMVLFKKEFIVTLGHPVQETTSVSWDLQTKNDKTIHEALYSTLRSKLTHNKESKTILEAYQGLAKGRIISLQQETHFHAHLIGRMLQSAINKAKDHETASEKQIRENKFGDTNTQFQKGLENALLKLNNNVLKLQAHSLEKAYAKANKKGGLDREQFATSFNKELDAARKKLLPEIAKTLRLELIKATGIQFNEQITKHLSKHLAEATSGSANDCIHIDKGMGFISFIGASEHTSHHQQLGGEHLADRMMYSLHLNEQKELVPLSDRQQVRVPSIAVKKLHSVTKKLLENDVVKGRLINAQSDSDLKKKINSLDPKNTVTNEEQQQIIQEYKNLNCILIKINGQGHYTDKQIKEAFDQLIISDTTDKISHLHDKYMLGGAHRFGAEHDDNELPHAFVYNLYTTLNSRSPLDRFDERNNKQSQSAEHILKAAHLYNRQNPEKPLCLVQNMAINGWGHELSIKDKNPSLINEAALMTQMASLHTIYGSLQTEDKQRVKKHLFKAYDDFIATDEASFYSYLKDHNSEALSTLETLKSTMIIPHSPDSTQIEGINEHCAAFTINAKNALASLFKEGAFGHHKNGYTYQALSVFVEKESFGGCKSANERAQAVNGRVSILDFVSLDKKTRDDLLDNYLSSEEAERLKGLSDHLEQGIHSRNNDDIAKHMDALYQSLNLEGYQAIISLIDQGGHAKLGTKGIIPNTNNSETVKTHVENASKWQCHKGLTDNVLREFCGIEKLSYGKELAKIANIIGLTALGAAGAGGIALGMAAVIGISAVFPPIGIAIGIAVAAAVGVAAIGALANFMYKLLTKNSDTKERFNTIQTENKNVSAQSAHEIQAQKDIRTKKENTPSSLEIQTTSTKEKQDKKMSMDPDLSCPISEDQLAILRTGKTQQIASTNNSQQHESKLTPVSDISEKKGLTL